MPIIERLLADQPAEAAGRAVHAWCQLRTTQNRLPYRVGAEGLVSREGKTLALAQLVCIDLATHVVGLTLDPVTELQAGDRVLLRTYESDALHPRRAR